MTPPNLENLQENIDEVQQPSPEISTKGSSLPSVYGKIASRFMQIGYATSIITGIVGVKPSFAQDCNGLEKCIIYEEPKNPFTFGENGITKAEPTVFSIEPLTQQPTVYYGVEPEPKAILVDNWTDKVNPVIPANISKDTPIITNDGSYYGYNMVSAQELQIRAEQQQAAIRAAYAQNSARVTTKMFEIATDNITGKFQLDGSTTIQPEIETDVLMPNSVIKTADEVTAISIESTKNTTLLDIAKQLNEKFGISSPQMIQEIIDETLKHYENPSDAPVIAGNPDFLKSTGKIYIPQKYLEVILENFDTENLNRNPIINVGFDNEKNAIQQFGPISPRGHTFTLKTDKQNQVTGFINLDNASLDEIAESISNDPKIQESMPGLTKEMVIEMFKADPQNNGLINESTLASRSETTLNIPAELANALNKYINSLIPGENKIGPGGFEAMQTLKLMSEASQDLLTATTEEEANTYNSELEIYKGILQTQINSLPENEKESIAKAFNEIAEQENNIPKILVKGSEIKSFLQALGISDISEESLAFIDQNDLISFENGQRFEYQNTDGTLMQVLLTVGTSQTQKQIAQLALDEADEALLKTVQELFENGVVNVGDDMFISAAQAAKSPLADGLFGKIVNGSTPILQLVEGQTGARVSLQTARQLLAALSEVGIPFFAVNPNIDIQGLEIVDDKGRTIRWSEIAEQAAKKNPLNDLNFKTIAETLAGIFEVAELTEPKPVLSVDNPDYQKLSDLEAEYEIAKQSGDAQRIQTAFYNLNLHQAELTEKYGTTEPTIARVTGGQNIHTTPPTLDENAKTDYIRLSQDINNPNLPIEERVKAFDEIWYKYSDQIVDKLFFKAGYSGPKDKDKRLTKEADDAKMKLYFKIRTQVSNGVFNDQKPLILTAYLSTAAGTRVIDDSRAAQLKWEVGPVDLFFGPQVATGDFSDELINQVYFDWVMQKAKEELDPRIYDAFDLYIQGYSGEEIAEKLNIEKGTVKSRVSRAKKAIKGIIEGKEITGDAEN